MFKGHLFGCVLASALTSLASIILIVAGAIFIKDIYYFHVLWIPLYSLSIFSIVIGILAIIFAIGLSYVVSRQFPALTTLFSFLFIIIVIFAAICGIILATDRSDLSQTSLENIQSLLRNYSDSDLILSSKPLIGRIQQSYKCCGANNATDWTSQLFDGTSTPDSCCKKIVPGCGYNSLITQDKIYLRGCAKPVYIDLRKKYLILTGINFTVMILALVSALCGFMFERFIRQQYQLM